MRRSAELGVYAALGPITGPLCAGVVRNLGKRRPVLAGLYAVAVIVVWFDLAGFGLALLPH